MEWVFQIVEKFTQKVNQLFLNYERLKWKTINKYAFSSSLIVLIFK